MAHTVQFNGYLSVGTAGDISSAIRAVNFPLSIEALDATVWSSDRTKKYHPGLKDFSFDVDFLDDLADNAINEDLFTDWDAASTIAVAYRLVNTTIGTGNPEYQFNAFIEGLTGGGAVGSLAGGKLTLRHTGALTRDVTP